MYRCPSCQTRARVRSTAPRPAWVQRYYACTNAACGERFSTFEKLLDRNIPPPPAKGPTLSELIHTLGDAPEISGKVSE